MDAPRRVVARRCGRITITGAEVRAEVIAHDHDELHVLGALSEARSVAAAAGSLGLLPLLASQTMTRELIDFHPFSAPQMLLS